MYRILITDYAWPTLDIEQDILGEIGGELVVAQTGAVDELIELAADVHAILTNWKKVPAAVLEAAPHCQIVCRYGVGLDNIDVVKATELGMLVTNVPDYCLEETSDHAMALLLACARSIVKLANSTRAGEWNLQIGRKYPRLNEQTLGIVGFGNIAQALVPKAKGFGLHIIAYTPHLTAERAGPHVEATNDLSYLLRQSDYVSLHVPATPQTHHLINAETLRQMKPTAYLINTARGSVVDEAALLTALQEGWIQGAGLDVLVNEAPNSNNPLLQLDNAIITPHAAFYSDSAIAELQHKAATQVKQVLVGERPRYIINEKVLAQENCRVKMLKMPHS